MRASETTEIIACFDTRALFDCRDGIRLRRLVGRKDAAGDWTYAASSTHDEFEAGTTYTDTFAVASADGTPSSVTINILGTPDFLLLV